MPLSYKDDEKQDERLDPYADSARELYHQEQDAYDREFNDIADNYDATADDQQENTNIAQQKQKTKNIDEAKEQEAAAGGWTNNVDNNTQSKEKGGFKAFFKKKGAAATIVTLLLGGSFGMSVLFSPGIAIVQLKEIMLNDLNDQLAATDIRSDHLLNAKLNSLERGLGVCSNIVNIGCKYSRMSKKMVANFQKAGFVIEPSEPDARFGGTKPTKITFPPTKVGEPGFVATNPTEMRNHLLNNPSARSAIRKAFNPKFASFSDSIAKKVFARFKSDKSQKVTGTTEEEMNQSITEATAGATAGIDADGHLTDDDGRKYVLDDQGNKVYESGDGSDLDRFNEIAERNRTNLSEIAEQASTSTTGSTAVGKLLSRAGKGVLATGIADTGCTVYNTGRAVAAAAKVARALQLFQYAMVFFNVADRIKAGDATAEEATLLGDKLTAVDTNKEVQDESSVEGVDDEGNIISAPVPNPYYGANAFDSPGYKTAAYNEAPTLTSRDLQYTVGGGLSGKLSNVMDAIATVVGGSRQNIRATCSVVQSWWVRSIGLAVGLASAIGSFGVSTALSIAGSVAIGFALPFLQAALADIIKGNTVSGATKGVDSGDAVFAGSGVLFGNMAMGHGLAPAGKKDLKQYLAVSNDVKNDYIAMETYEAKDTPFDITKQYSFLGSAVRKINPAVIKSTASMSGALITVPSLLSTAFTGLVPHAQAYEKFNDERFSKCVDDAYAELGIDADVFCNVRYYMSPEQLAMDPLVAAQWMTDNGHIEPDGTPKSDEYKDWIKFCTEREDGWGETSNDDPGDQVDKEIGKICVEKNEQTTYFPVLFLDKLLQESMDGEGDTSSSQAAFTIPADAAKVSFQPQSTKSTNKTEVVVHTRTTTSPLTYAHSPSYQTPIAYKDEERSIRFTSPKAYTMS